MIVSENLNGVTGVYCAIHRDSLRCYVGGSVDIGDRRSKHKSSTETNAFHKETRKLGIDSFDFELVEKCDESVLRSREDFWISFYKSASQQGFNTFASSSWHPKAPVQEATKRRISEAMKGKKKSDAHKKKLSLARIGVSIKGNMSMEGRQKLAMLRKTIPHSPATLEKMRVANIGRKHTPETIIKIKNARLDYWAKKKNNFNSSCEELTAAASH